MSSCIRRTFCSVLAIVFLIGIPAHAEGLKDSTSLKFVSADVSFYATLLRNREQVEIFLASNAYNKLKNLPLVTFGVTMVQGQLENPQSDELKKFKEIWEQEENQQLKEILLDAVSNEIFFYGDANFTELLKLGQEFQRVARKIQIRSAQQDAEADKELADAIIGQLERVKTPGGVIGFKVSDPARIQQQIDRLEKHLGELLEEQEELKLKDRLKREDIDGFSFLVFSVDGSMVPWDQVPEETRERLGDRGRAAVSKLKLTISLGVKEGYLILAVGESTDLVKSLGKASGKLLIDAPELAALRKYEDRRIVNVSYTSRGFMENANSASSQIDDLASTAETVLPIAELSEEKTAAIVADIKSFGNELKGLIPKAGPTSSFSFLTDTGYEGFQYNWGENKAIDASKKLTILEHLGGDPIGFSASRSKYQPEVFDFIGKWLNKVWEHAQEIGISKLNDEERQRFEQVRDRAVPLVKRLAKATRDDLVPSLKDGQAAIVLDAKASSKQWHRDLPTTRVALPMLGLAIVCGVSDEAGVKRAGAEYFKVVQDALDAAHELHQEQVPKIDLPAPEVTKADGGQIYSYKIPEAAGLDAQFTPNIALSKDVLVLSLFPEQSKRLLQSSAMKRLGQLNEADRPLGAASYFNVTELMNAITPWVNYAVRIAGQGEGENVQQARVAAQMVAGNVSPILDLLKCLGEHSSVTYIEDGAIVTHSASHLVDAP